MAARLVSFIRDTATRGVNEFVRIRAGAVAIRGRAIVMPSPPQAHLATLVGLLLRSGGAYLGDEVVYVDPILRRVEGPGLPLHVDAEDIGTLMPELLREPLPRRPGEPLSDFLRAATPRRLLAPEDFGSTTSPPVEISWVVFPFFEAGAETSLGPMSGAEAVFRFTQSALNLQAWEGRALILMQEILQDAAVSRLTVGSMTHAADLLSASVSRFIKG